MKTLHKRIMSYVGFLSFDTAHKFARELLI